jgi:hypothetical protein
VTGTWRRMRKQLLDGLQVNRRYWKLKEKALDRSRWRTRIGRGNGLFVRQTWGWIDGWMNEWMSMVVVNLKQI